ncbi:MAG TPA: bifunctional NADH-specific enoyl-ACP reductase/trans-2-enoyl-CoA reductase, partial [Porticoccaceae bacterium]|nr:bifunctional NADH-specific enoyl-ACP reductase/trans-2-enoyl-CoA reductase [Porticoccaceae bacterium]
MVIKPKVRGFICTNAHPVGCAAHVRQQIDYVKSKGAIDDGPKKVLVIGSSTGYGLASRITAA